MYYCIIVFVLQIIFIQWESKCVLFVLREKDWRQHKRSNHSYPQVINKEANIKQTYKQTNKQAHKHKLQKQQSKHTNTKYENKLTNKLKNKQTNKQTNK